MYSCEEHDDEYVEGCVACEIANEFNTLKTDNKSLEDSLDYYRGLVGRQMDVLHDIDIKIHDMKLSDEAEVKRLREALESISKNTCCSTCQEAALVAKQALKGD